MAEQQMNPEEMSWEDRVRGLEAKVEAQASALAEKAGQLQAVEAQLEAAQAAVEAHKAAQAEREAQAFAAFMGDIKEQACKAGSPIPEEDLAKVAETHKSGQADLAKTLADAFLARSKALGSGSVRGEGPQTVSLGATSTDPKSQADYAAEARQRWNLKSKEA